MKIKMHDLYVMFVISVMSGILSAMFIWSDKMSDIRLSFNDFFMAFLMTGWMFLLMGFYYKMKNHIMIGLLLILGSLVLIRNQFFINESQFIKGMIPHHSMGILMSRKLLEKNLNISQELKDLAVNIIKTQENEINILKKLE